MGSGGSDAIGLLRLAREGRLTEFGEQVADLLGEGRLAAVGPRLEVEVDPPLPIRVVLADLRSRSQSVELFELVELDREARAALEAPGAGEADVDLARWTTAVLAEWGLWKGDLSTIGYGHGELASAGPPRSRWGRVAEARRRRIDALAGLVTEPEAARTAAAIDGVREALAATGCREEAAISDVVFAYGRLGIADDLSLEPMANLAGGVEVLDHLDADRLPFGLALLAWSAYMIGDFPTAAGALDRFGELTPSGPVSPVVSEGVGMLRGLVRLVVEGPDPLVIDRIGQHFERMRRYAAPAWFVGPVANDLLDVGETTLAATVVEAVGSLGSFIRPAHQAIREVEARIRLLDAGDRAAVDDLWDLYGEWEADGRWRRAASSALRCSWTARRAGMEAEADRLRRWGMGRIPPREERTRWETIWVDGLLARPAAVPQGEIRILGPSLAVHRRGREVPLTGAPARLLTILVAVRRPVTVDWIVDTLWPGSDPRLGRRRLEEALHDLRHRLGLLPDELLRRRRSSISVDATGWDIDGWRFLDLSSGAAESKLEALDLYRADLVADDPTDLEVIHHERERFRRRWEDTALSLVEAGALSRERVEAMAGRLSARAGLLT